MKRFLQTVRWVIPIAVIALVFLVSHYFYGDQSYTSLAFFGAIGGLLGGDDIEDAIHGEWSNVLELLSDMTSQMQNTYEQDRERFSQGFLDIQNQWDTTLDQMRTQLGDAHAESMGYLKTGADDMYEQMRLQGQERVGSEMAAQARTGLANTSFGRGMVGAIEAQTARDIGTAKFGVSRELSAAVERHAQAMQGLNQYGLEGSTGLQQARLGGLSQLDQNWMRILQGQVGSEAGYRAQKAGAIIGNEQQNVAAGQSAFGNILSGLGF